MPTSVISELGLYWSYITRDVLKIYSSLVGLQVHKLCTETLQLQTTFFEEFTAFAILFSVACLFLLYIIKACICRCGKKQNNVEQGEKKTKTD